MTKDTEFDPLDPRGQEAAEAIAAAEVRHRRHAEIKDFKWLMSRKEGRRFVWRQLDKAGVFRLSFTGNAPQTDFNEGMRNSGLALLADIIEHCPERFNQMLMEHKQDDGSSRSNQ